MSLRFSNVVFTAFPLTVAIGTNGLGAQVAASPLSRAAVAPITTARQPLGMALGLPAGLSAQLVGNTNLGSTAAGTSIALGSASTFSLQEAVPTYAGGGIRNPEVTPPKLTGSVQFAAGDQQAMSLYSCFQAQCFATLTVFNVTPQGTITYVLGNTKLTAVTAGQAGVSATFAYQTLQWQGTGPTGTPMAALPVPAGPASAPQGITITMQTPQSNPVSLGMAATFQLAQSRPNPNAAATGTIQFAPNNAQALQLNACLLSGCTASIAIMNVTPQGTTVYALSNVLLTSATIGQTTTIGFSYWAAQWQTFAPGSNQASQSGTM
jgi:hypothetical protein